MKVRFLTTSMGANAAWPLLWVTMLCFVPTARAQENLVKIRIALESSTVMATLDDNPTARDFAALLPLTLQLEDYASTEKISDLPKRLTRDGAPSASKGNVGDISLYAPWGNLAIFYRQGPHAPGLIRIGRITSGIEVLSHPGSMRATISRVD